jgi:predicted metal-dependent peptidase
MYTLALAREQLTTRSQTMENPNDKIAAERVAKARAELIMSRRFYGVLVSNVEPVLSRQVKRAATDSTKHYWNPDFVASLERQTQVVFVQAHESEHDASKHSMRRGNRDPERWNKACDYAINLVLKDQGFDLLDDVLIDEKYRGMSAEDIYRSMELDEQRQQKQQQQQDEQESEDSDSPEASDGEGDQDSEDQEADDGEGDDESSDDTDEGDTATGNGDPDDEDEDQDDGDGKSESPDADHGEQDQDNEGKGGTGDSDEQADEKSSDGDGEGDGESEDEQSEGEGDAQAEGDQGDDGEQENGKPLSNGGGDFPGSVGEVLDAPPSTDGPDPEQKWDRIVRQAAAMAKARGQLPGHVTAEIERSNNPTQDWRETLRAWFDQGSLQTETWNRPNRRFIGQGLYLPGRQRDGINRVAFLIDTSASCDDIALAQVRDETQAALDDGAIDEIIVVYGDVQVTRVDTYHQQDEIVFDPRGRGGTDMRPLFAYVEEQIDDCSLIVNFTDLEIGDPGPQPSCPVLFAVHGYPERVRQYIAHAPWGAPAIDVGVRY